MRVTKLKVVEIFVGNKSDDYPGIKSCIYDFFSNK